jgi:hypothetical protein
MMREAAKTIMMVAATASDAVKDDGAEFKDDGDDPTDPTKAPDLGRNTGVEDKCMRKYRHHIDVPFSPDLTRLRLRFAVTTYRSALR